MFQPLPLFVGLRYSWSREHSFFVSFISWVSFIGVALGVAFLIAILSVMNGFESELRGKLLSLASHARVDLRGEQARDWRRTMDTLRGTPHLVGAAPFLDIDVMMSHAPSMSGAVIRGVDPRSEPSVSEITDSMREGSLSELTPGSGRIVLGRALAYDLQVARGDIVTVMVPSRGANGTDIIPRLQGFEVSGIFESGLQEHDSVLALVNLEDAQGLKKVDAPAGIRLKFDDVMRAPRFAEEVRERLGPQAVVRDWTQDNAAFFRAIRIEKSMMSFILLLVVVVAAFNIVATLVMVVTDKRTDVAILRTLGLSPGGVIAIFITQGVLIGWIGTALGVVFGVILGYKAGPIMSGLERLFNFHLFDPDVFAIAGLPSELHALDVALIALAALLLTFVATIYPSLRAARIAPADALRYD